MADAKMLKKVPEENRIQKYVQQTLKKFVLDTIRKKQWKKHRDA